MMGAIWIRMDQHVLNCEMKERQVSVILDDNWTSSAYEQTMKGQGVLIYTVHTKKDIQEKTTTIKDLAAEN